MSTTQDLQGLLEQCRAVRAAYEDDALVIVPAVTVEELLADAAELRNLQRLIARLPDDDWQPFDFAIFRGLVEHVRDYNEDTETSGPGAGCTAPDRGQHPGRGAVMANDNASRSDQPKRGEPQRFIRSLTTSEAGASCVEWPFATNYSGYGVLTWKGRTSRAHVVVATIAHGPKPDGCEVAHSCANRACVNPMHLRWATHAENMADRDEHGTTARGEKVGRARLVEQQVREVRDAYRSGAPLDDIAARFDISSSAAWSVATGDSWGWFEPDDIPPARGPVNQYMGKTHCKHGHEFTQANTLVDKRGRRLCRACADIRRKKHADRKAGK